MIQAEEIFITTSQIKGSVAEEIFITTSQIKGSINPMDTEVVRRLSDINGRNDNLNLLNGGLCPPPAFTALIHLYFKMRILGKYVDE